MQAAATKPRRRWFQFGLGMMFAAIAAVAIVCAVGAYQYQRYLQRQENFRRLQSLVEISIQDAPLADALDQWSNGAKVRVYADPDVSLNERDSVVMSGIQARSALTLLLRNRGLDYSVTPSGVCIHRERSP